MHYAASPRGVLADQVVSRARAKLWPVVIRPPVLVLVALQRSKHWTLRSRSCCASSGVTCSSGTLVEYVDFLLQSHMSAYMYTLSLG